MKGRAAAVLIISLLILGACARASEPTLDPTRESDSLKFFQDGAFQALLPTWDEVDPDDTGALLFLARDSQQIILHRIPSPPVLVIEGFLADIENDPAKVLVLREELAGKPFFEYTSRENQHTLRYQIVVDYCQGQTYALVAGGKDTVANADLFTQVLSSSRCEDDLRIADLDTGKIGMRVNPPGGDYWTGYYPSLRLAKESGVQVLHSYLAWGSIEQEPGVYQWEWNDALMDLRFQEGFEVSLVVNVIHTALRGSMPEDLQDKDFDDPEFIQRFTDFILAALERYPVDYLSIGNEVNDYFISHRDEIPAYTAFFLAVKDAVQAEYPDLQIGMTFAYHDAESTGSVDLIQSLNLGDFLPLTLYIYSPGFLFDRDPTELEGYLDRILDLAGEQQVAFVELGWNTSPSLSSSQEAQAAFVRETFRLLAENRERIEFVSWFQLHDEILDDTYAVARSFLPEDSHLLSNEEYMRAFVDFLNYMGLIENDGTPKQAWSVFQDQARSYLEGVQ